MWLYLDVSPEVAAALAAGKPVVALESTIISHGMPYPQNVETALAVEAIIRENGAVPATIAIIGGASSSRSAEMSMVVSAPRWTPPMPPVANTLMPAMWAMIMVVVTVVAPSCPRAHSTARSRRLALAISADLEELAHTPVMVVCAGAKSILDLGLTLEYLETAGASSQGLYH